MLRGAGPIVFGLLLSLAAATAQVPASRPKKQELQTKASQPKSGDLERDVSFDLLEEAYATSRDLPSEIHIPLLPEICQRATSINSKSTGVFGVHRRGSAQSKAPVHPELTKKQKGRVKDWIEELYLAGNEFPVGSRERSVSETVATRTMAEIDIDRAMEMFEANQSISNPEFDSRMGLEYVLFEAFYQAKGVAALPELRRKANEFGDQGSYPFSAVASLLDHVNGHPQIVRQFFNDAMTYFRRGNYPITKIYGILGMVGSKSVRDQLESWQVQDAAQQLASQAKRYVQSQREMQSSGAGTAPGAPMVVNAIRASLKQFAPEVAATIPDPPAFVAPARSTPPAAQKVPQAPVSDESLKDLRSSFEANRTAVMVLNENEVHDGPEMQDTIDRAVTQGAEVVLRTVHAYDPEDHAYAMRMNISPLIDTVQVGTRVNPAATLAAIRRIQDSELKARLLVVVAGSVEFLE